MKKIKPSQVKSFIPTYAWDSRGKEKVSKTNWAKSGWWMGEVKHFIILFPGLVKVVWNEPALRGDLFAIYDAKIELYENQKS